VSWCVQVTTLARHARAHVIRTQSALAMIFPISRAPVDRDSWAMDKSAKVCMSLEYHHHHHSSPPCTYFCEFYIDPEIAYIIRYAHYAH